MSDTFKCLGRVDDGGLVVVPKGWGWERWLANGPPYCMKELVFCKGRRCSYHYHRRKDETFLVVSGEVVVDHFGETTTPPGTPEEARLELTWARSCVLGPGDVFHVPPLTRHRVYARRDSKLVEASTEHFEDDSYRLLPGD